MANAGKSVHVIPWIMDSFFLDHRSDKFHVIQIISIDEVVLESSNSAQEVLVKGVCSDGQYKIKTIFTEHALRSFRKRKPYAQGHRTIYSVFKLSSLLLQCRNLSQTRFPQFSRDFIRIERYEVGFWDGFVLVIRSFVYFAPNIDKSLAISTDAGVKMIEFCPHDRNFVYAGVALEDRLIQLQTLQADKDLAKGWRADGDLEQDEVSEPSQPFDEQDEMDVDEPPTRSIPSGSPDQHQVRESRD